MAESVDLDVLAVGVVDNRRTALLGRRIATGVLDTVGMQKNDLRPGDLGSGLEAIIDASSARGLNLHL